MDVQPPFSLTPNRLAQLKPGHTLLGQLQTIAPALPRVVGITPAVAVVDSDLLLQDLKYTVSHETHTALMIAARTGLLRLFAALPVWHEIMRHIDDLAAVFGWDPTQARRIWLARYAPWIYFIDAARLPATHPLVLEGARRDPKDTQTAQLVIALTPDMFLSCNRKHFPGLQPVGEKWLTVSLAYRDKFVRDVSSMETTLMWSMVGSMGVEMTEALVHGIASVDRRILIGGAIGFVLIAALASLHRPTRDTIVSEAKKTWSGVTDAINRILPTGIDQAAQRDVAASHAQQVLNAVGRTDANPYLVRDFAATALARTAVFLPVDQLQGEMATWGYASGGPGAAHYVRRVLRGLPGLFREDTYGRWGLSVLRALPPATVTGS